MGKLWEKGSQRLDTTIEQFETADDLVLDMNLVEEDIYGSLAHSFMLNSIKLLTKDELKKIHRGLLEILDSYKKGKFKLQFGDEDIHTKIENELTKKFGSPGKKVHTGRSRNDQVSLDLRLYTKKKLLVIWEKHLKLSQTLLNLAKKYAHIPMPGYTHMQKGMPSSVGMWFGAFGESMLDNIELLNTAFKLNNQSPLGSGASYGVSLPLNRQLVADLLGFAKVQNNSLYCQNSRGKIESIVMFVFVQTTLDISKLASDLLLFTTSEYNFFKISPKLYSGSSIMPQKKNLDIAELLRSKIHIIQGYYSQVINTIINLPSGYNRDFQDTKKPYMESVELMIKILDVATMLVKNIIPNENILRSTMTSDLYATSAVYQLVQKGVPFREAYRQVGENLKTVKVPDIDAYIKQSTHQGATGNLQLNQALQIWKKNSTILKNEGEKYKNALEKLINML